MTAEAPFADKEEYIEVSREVEWAARQKNALEGGDPGRAGLRSDDERNEYDKGILTWRKLISWKDFWTHFFDWSYAWQYFTLLVIIVLVALMAIEHHKVRFRPSPGH